MTMAASTELNLLHLIAFLIQIVPCVTGKFLETLFFGGSSFESYLNNRKHILYHLITSPSSSYTCCECQRKPIGSRCISQSQFDMLFERSGNVLHKHPCICEFQARTNIDTSILDVTLSTCILNNCESVLSTHDHHLKTIRSIRNSLFHSSSSTVLTSAIFNDLWIRLQGAISGLTSAISPEYGSEIQMQIESLQRKQLVGDDEEKLLDDWLTLKQTLCGIQENTTKIEDIGQSFKQLQHHTMEHHLEEKGILEAVKHNTEVLLEHASHRKEENKSNNDNIYIHIPQLERTFPVLYRKTQTVEELKTQIHHKEGVKKSDQYLSFRTSALKDDDTLGRYNIKKGDTVQLKIVQPDFAETPSNSHTCSIYIHIPQLERTFQVLYRKNQTVEELKTQIHHKEGWKKTDQYLSFRTSGMNDDDTLEHYNIKKGDTVQLKIVEPDFAALFRERFEREMDKITKKFENYITRERSSKYQKAEDEFLKKNTVIQTDEDKIESKIRTMEEKSLILAEIRCLKDENGMRFQQLDGKVHELGDKIVQMDGNIQEVKILLNQLIQGTNVNKLERPQRPQDRIGNRFLRDRKRKQLRRRCHSYQRDPRYASTDNVSMAVTTSSKELYGSSDERNKRGSSIKIKDHDICTIEDDLKRAASTTQCVFILDLNGKYIKIELHYCRTIFDIKHKIQNKTGVPVGSQKLIYGGLVLDNQVSVETYGIQDFSKVYLTYQQDKRNISEIILIRHVSSSVTKMTDMRTHQSVIDLKLWVRHLVDLPTSRGINMMFKGRQLYNDDDIGDIGIKAHDKIYWYDFPLQYFEIANRSTYNSKFTLHTSIC